MAHAAGRLAGKVALITGTGGGQGRAAARMFAAEGATVVGCDLKTDGAAETVELVRSAGGVMDSAAPIDLTDESAVSSWITGAATRHGRIDVLYNNAGATRFDPIEDESYDDWQFTLRNELDVVFLATKHAWPHLKRRGGSVILVGSTAGLTGSQTLMRSAHTATKGGVIALTRQLAAEGAPFGIRVNCISPGMVLSPATQDDIFGDPEHPMFGIRQHIPLGRIGTPDDIVPCAVFLASDESSYMTGANLVIDGGWSVVLPGAPRGTGTVTTDAVGDQPAATTGHE